MEGHASEDVEALLAFSVRDSDRPGLEVRVNFGVFAGREATRAEIEDLAGVLLPEVGQVEIVAEQRYEFGPEVEAEVHQVRVVVPVEAIPDGDYAEGELAGKLVAIADRWARTCIAHRHAEITEL